MLPGTIATMTNPRPWQRSSSHPVDPSRPHPTKPSNASAKHLGAGRTPSQLPPSRTSASPQPLPRSPPPSDPRDSPAPSFGPPSPMMPSFEPSTDGHPTSMRAAYPKPCQADLKPTLAPTEDGGPSSSTPSLSAILSAFRKDGKGDRDLLVALLEAKRKEDERSAARDQLRAEELRAQTIYYYSYLMAATSQYALPPAPSHGYPSPPPPVGAPTPPEKYGSPAYDRSRSQSVVSSVSIPLHHPGRQMPPPPPGSTIGTKRRRSSDATASTSGGTVYGDDAPPTREEAMQALRAKIARTADIPVVAKKAKATGGPRKRKISSATAASRSAASPPATEGPTSPSSRSRSNSGSRTDATASTAVEVVAVEAAKSVERPQARVDGLAMLLDVAQEQERRSVMVGQ